MKDVVGTAVMRRSDKEEIENGTPSRTLMLRAGKAVASSHDFNGRTAIVCGTGNNAGDGYVIALEINDGTRQCVLFLLKEKFSEDGAYYFDLCRKAGIEYRVIDDREDFSEFDTVVDCIFGTGYKGTPDEKTARVIDKINASGAFVLSVDINSGLNGDNGLGDKFVISDLTVSIGTYKSGHFLGKAKDAIKRLVNADIGIPVRGEKYALVEERDFCEFVRERKNFSHKGDYGFAAIAGGCENYCGAIKLASSSLAALRAGCGVSRIIAPRSVLLPLMKEIKESTLFGISGRKGRMNFRAAEWRKAMDKVTAIAVGMGWGEGKRNEAILKFLIENYDVPVIIDADGLNALSRDKSILRNKKAQVILTPHIGEMSRLTGLSAKEIASSPIKCAEDFAKNYGVTVVLKGPTTVVTDGEKTYLVNRGCAGMATAGSGDVLSGIIVGTVAKRPENLLLSVAYATFINGLSGEMAQREKTDICMTSADTVTKIPEAVIYCRDASK